MSSANKLLGVIPFEQHSVDSEALIARRLEDTRDPRDTSREKIKRYVSVARACRVYRVFFEIF